MQRLNTIREKIEEVFLNAENENKCQKAVRKKLSTSVQKTKIQILFLLFEYRSPFSFF
jgi:hypothetical protein